MRESKFIQNNYDKWQRLEKILQGSKYSPDAISDLFLQITQDLSYAKTYYDRRSVKLYLNSLAIHLIYRLMAFVFVVIDSLMLVAFMLLLLE